MSLTKSLEVSAQEIYCECVELLSAMNYGKVEQKIQYKVISEENLSTNYNFIDKAAIVDSSEVDTAEKAIATFKH